MRRMNVRKERWVPDSRLWPWFNVQGGGHATSAFTLPITAKTWKQSFYSRVWRRTQHFTYNFWIFRLWALFLETFCCWSFSGCIDLNGTPTMEWNQPVFVRVSSNSASGFLSVFPSSLHTVRHQDASRKNVLGRSSFEPFSESTLVGYFIVCHFSSGKQFLVISLPIRLKNTPNSQENSPWPLAIFKLQCTCSHCFPNPPETCSMELFALGIPVSFVPSVPWFILTFSESFLRVTKGHFPQLLCSSKKTRTLGGNLT